MFVYNMKLSSQEHLGEHIQIPAHVDANMNLN